MQKDNLMPTNEYVERLEQLLNSRTEALRAALTENEQLREELKELNAKIKAPNP